jgi:hypothetical protein
MAISLMQKIRLVLRGWMRRREEKEQEFLRRNTGWGASNGAPAAAAAEPAKAEAPSGGVLKSIDMDGLQAAYLDNSGQIAYYLDFESGEVVEKRDGSLMDGTRYKRIPSGGGDIAERRAFIETLEPSDMRLLLMKSVNSPTFRSVLASDRSLERAWYNFRNDRATAAIEAWLVKSGLR